MGWSSALELTQEQAIALSLKKNFNILIKKIDSGIQEQSVDQEKGEFYPIFSATYMESFNKQDGQDQRSQSMQASVGGKLPFGTTYTIGLDAAQEEYETTDGIYYAFSGITLTQPLLKGFGLDSNWAWVRIADRQHRIEKWNLKQTVLDVVLQVVFAYNHYFLAQQNAEVALRNRNLAEQLVADNRKRIEQGTMSPVDIAVAEAELAVREERVLRTHGHLRIQENNLKNLVFDDYRTVIHTDLIINQLPEPSEPNEDLIQDFAFALEQQPAFKIKQISREIENIRLDHALNQQMMDLSVNTSYGMGGYGNSIGNSIKQIGKNNAADYSVGLSMSYPIPNRRARAETISAHLRLRQVGLGIEQLKQEIILNLHSGIILIETNWHRIRASRKARELSDQMLQAEQKKLQAGTSSTFVVLRLQNDVANAQIQEFQTISDYNISLAQLARLKGML